MVDSPPPLELQWVLNPLRITIQRGMVKRKLQYALDAGLKVIMHLIPGVQDMDSPAYLLSMRKWGICHKVLNDVYRRQTWVTAKMTETKGAKLNSNRSNGNDLVPMTS